MSTRSRFSAASVLVFAFFAEPTSVRIINTFGSVFAFALRSSLVLPEMYTRMLDDESLGNSVKVACVTAPLSMWVECAESESVSFAEVNFWSI